MSDPTTEQIVKARDKCAQIIVTYGEHYLPIFERLEKEISLREKQRELLEKAIRISGKMGTQNGTQNGTHLKFKFLKHSK